MATYLHHVPGRLRVRNPNLKGNPLAAQSVRRRIGRIHGVRSIEINIITGSILVSYDRKSGAAAQLLRLLGRPQSNAPRVRAKRPLRSHLAPVGRIAAPWVAEKLLSFALERALVALVAAVI